MNAPHEWRERIEPGLRLAINAILTSGKGISSISTNREEITRVVMLGYRKSAETALDPEVAAERVEVLGTMLDGIVNEGNETEPEGGES